MRKCSLYFVGEQEVIGPLIPKFSVTVAAGSGQGDSSSGKREKFAGLKFYIIDSKLLQVIFSQKVFAIFIAAFCLCLDR